MDDTNLQDEDIEYTRLPEALGYAGTWEDMRRSWLDDAGGDPHLEAVNAKAEALYVHFIWDMAQFYGLRLDEATGVIYEKPDRRRGDAEHLWAYLKKVLASPDKDCFLSAAEAVAAV